MWLSATSSVRAAVSPRAAGCAPSGRRPSWRRPRVSQLLGGHVERVAVEHDEVGEVAGQELAAAALVAGEPGGVDASTRRAPARPSAPARGATPGGRRSCRRTPARMPASGSSSSTGASEPFATTRARVQQRAEGVGAVRLARPRSGRRGRGPTARARTAPSGDAERARSAGRPRARDTARARSAGGARAAPDVARRLERVERLAVRAVADRVDRDRPAGRGAARGRSPRARRRS